MSENYVLYSTDGTIATITLNRPEYLNAIVRPMWTQLDHFIAEANRDPEIKVIVLRGAGRAFCAGFDFGADGDMAAVRGEGRAWDPGRDAIGVTNRWDAPVPNFMGLWSSP
ncbi:MAG: enoyl-CoA hydratase/isomerase family protein, partial [bacterium]|nr:enoyl-CoA hydratase/isomerase family protein [bacterium]